MSNTEIQFRRGPSQNLDSFTGVEGELTYDTDTGELRTHDGVTIGGTILARKKDVSVQLPSVAALREYQGRYDGDVVETVAYYDGFGAGGNKYVWDATSTATDDGGSVIAVNVVSTGRWVGQFPNGFSATQFGAKGDANTDDTNSVQKAHDYGMPLFESNDSVFLISSLSAKVSVSGGTYKRMVGSAGNFISTSNEGVKLNCNVDCSSLAGFGFEIRHENCGTGCNFHLHDCGSNGVDARDHDNITILGRVENCAQTHVFCMAQNADMNNLKIDVLVDGTAIGTDNLNGGVKVHGTASYSVNEPIINANVSLFESESMPPNSVCIETLTNVSSPKITGVAKGGSIGCTMNGSPNGIALVKASGQHMIGLEITNGSHGAKFVKGSSSKPGLSVLVNNCCQGDRSNNIEFDAVAEDPTDSRDPVSANFYLTECIKPKVKGYAKRTGGRHYIRLRDTTGFKAIDLDSEGTGIGRAISYETVNVGCDDVSTVRCSFVGVTIFINANGNYNKGSFKATVIDNSGNFIGGSATLTNYQFSTDCEANDFQVGQGDIFNFLDYKQAPEASLLQAWGSGSPEGATRAAIGSVYYRTDGGSSTTIYVKESGESTVGWVAK